MNKFKPGDKVTLVNADRYHSTVKQLVGKTLVVHCIGADEEGNDIVSTGILENEDWFWPDDLQLISKSTEVEQKSLFWGDLVEYSGEICMVFDERPTDYGERLLVMLDNKGRGGYHYVPAKYLTRLGSIRKKIKRAKKFKKAMEEAK